MQAFDTAALLITLILLGILLLSRTRPIWVGALSFALAACVFLHAVGEGFRWQMTPAYIAVVATLLWAMFRVRNRDRPPAKRVAARVGTWASVFVATTLLTLSALFSYAFPIFEILEPTGAYRVGTTEMHLVDENRAESYTDDPSDHRELMVRIWYPTETIEGTARASYWRNSVKRSAAVTGNTPLPWFTFTHLGLVATHSYWDAPMAERESSYPVVLYSHGIGIGWASANTKLAEALASHGYVVVGINHAFIGSISMFPDGRAATFDAATAQAMNQPPPTEVASLQTRLRESRDWQEQVELYARAMELMPGQLNHVTNALSIQVADHQFVMNQLDWLQRDGQDPLASHLDLERVGIIGMSLGGSAAFETCSIDNRCMAGVNLDGFHPRHIGSALQNTPFLFMNRYDNLLYKTNFLAAQSPVYSVRVSGATHFNFFDFSIMSPLYRRLGVLGPIDGNRMLKITEDHVLGFLDEHLRKGSNVNLAAVAGNYAEVTFAQRNK